MRVCVGIYFYLEQVFKLLCVRVSFYRFSPFGVLKSELPTERVISILGLIGSKLLSPLRKGLSE